MPRRASTRVGGAVIEAHPQAAENFTSQRQASTITRMAARLSGRARMLRGSAVPTFLRAARPAALPVDAPAAPIVKWVGGKTKLLTELTARMPARFGRYYEPFAGGAALFFRTAPRRAVLADSNTDLVALYTA